MKIDTPWNGYGSKMSNLGIEEEPQNGMALISHVESSKLLQYSLLTARETHPSHPSLGRPISMSIEVNKEKLLMNNETSTKTSPPLLR